MTSLSGTGTITPKTITATLTKATDIDKVYDGSTSSVLGTNYALTDLVAGDKVQLTADGSYASKNAGAQNVTYTNLKLDNGNYKLADTVTSLTGAGTITKKDITAAAITGASIDKEYDGTTDVKGASFVQGKNFNFANIIDADQTGLSLSAGTGSYAAKNVTVNAQNVTFGSLTLAGTAAGNYNLTSTSLTAQGKITPRALTASVKTGVSFAKVYDGKTDVTQALEDGSYSFANLVQGDKVNITGTAGSGSYDAKDAGSRTVKFTGLSLSGQDAGNYTFDGKVTGTGTITPKIITAALKKATGIDKVYDGTKDAAALGSNYSLTGFVGNESAGLTSTGGSYNSKDVAAATTVTYGGLQLDNGNYKLDVTSLTGSGKITAKEVTAGVRSGASFDRTYDSTKNAQLGQDYQLTGMVSGDSLGLTANGSYESADAGSHTVSFDGLHLTGGDAGNYVLRTNALTGSGRIDRATLVLTAAPVTIQQGQPVPGLFQGTLSGFQGSDALQTGDTVTWAMEGQTGAAQGNMAPGYYGVSGYLNGKSSGDYGKNYRFVQNGQNSRAFCIMAPMGDTEYRNALAPLAQLSGNDPEHRSHDRDLLLQSVSSNVMHFYRMPHSYKLEEGGIRLPEHELLTIGSQTVPIVSNMYSSNLATDDNQETQVSD